VKDVWDWGYWRKMRTAFLLDMSNSRVNRMYSQIREEKGQLECRWNVEMVVW
jgi:hypothetical protein